ncbi:MAG: M28 family peptidase, partial [Planctomycetota bacterium]
WSRRSSSRNKIRAAASRNPAAIIMVNTPGANDPRIDTLEGSSRTYAEVPVLVMSPEAGQRLIAALDPEGRTATDLRFMADEGRAIVDLGGDLQVLAEVERIPLTAENVGGIIPGRGDLADEWIVVGAHLDHLGMGNFGSRSGPGELHPGADDNASGTAGIMLFAKQLVESYEQLPDNADARSILFMAFSAEESGLNGSRFYADNPIAPIDKHVLMINFDMIGRIEDGRLSVSGAKTGAGMDEWLAPYFEESPLTIVLPERMSGASDHTSFYRKQMPVLFGIIADFHDDYHTPRDIVSKINRVGAVETIRLFHDIALDYAQLDDTFAYVEQPRRGRGGGRPSGDQERGGGGVSDIKVRFGVVPATYEEGGEPGIPIRTVSDGGSAEKAGILAGDVLMEWNGATIRGMGDWIQMLTKHEPGDIVSIMVVRDGEQVTMKATLQAKAGG